MYPLSIAPNDDPEHIFYAYPQFDVHLPFAFFAGSSAAKPHERVRFSTSCPV